MAEPGPGAGTERCPHCHRAFKRLRTHLPHCKAAPRKGPESGTSLRTGPGSAPGSTPAPAPGSASGPGERLRQAPTTAPGSAPSPGPRPGPASSSGSGAKRKTSPAPATAPGSAPSPGPLPTPASTSASAPGAGSAPGAKRKTSPAPATAPGSAPSPDPLPTPGPATGSVPGPSSAPSPRPAPGTDPGPGLGAPGTGRDVEPAVQDVARALDLLPEEVEDVPQRLENGVKVVIEKHRARVVREKKPRSGAGAAGGTDPGRAAHPQRGKTAPKSTHKETQSLGAVRGVPGSKKGGKSSLKATKVLEEPPEGRNSPGDLVQQERTDKSMAGEEQVHREVGVGYKAPVSDLHPKNLHLSVMEGLGGHSEGPSKNELSSLERLRDSREQMVGVSKPVLGTGRDPGLALHQSCLHSPKFQPTCSSQASGRSTWAGATGLEWFPDLYPEHEGLRIFPGKHFQEDVGITVKAPRGSFSEGHRGPLSERPLMEVRLGELHSRISTCDFSPQGLLGAVQKAWNSYYAKYMNVRRGGHTGISMLLTGYCLLSYSWNYQHFKRHRWRKYH